MRWRIWRKTGRDISWDSFREWVLKHAPGTGWRNMWNGWKN